MLKKLDLKQQLTISGVIALTTVTLLSIAVFVLLGTKFTFAVLLNYIILSLVLGLYLFVIMKLQYNVAFLLFIIGYFFAFGVLFFAYAGGSKNGFTDLAGIVGFMIILGLVMVLGVVLEILMKTRSNLKQELKAQNETKEYIDVEVVDKNEDKK